MLVLLVCVSVFYKVKTSFETSFLLELVCLLCYLDVTIRVYAVLIVLYFFFFFSSRRRHTRFDCDWSSDVCSSDLGVNALGGSHPRWEQAARISSRPAEGAARQRWAILARCAAIAACHQRNEGGLALIKVSQLVFEYPGHRALDGVSVHIAAGTVTALVGPNGAGKSTLMRCIAGLDQPLSGQVEVHGIAVQEQPREVHRHLGYLSDFFGLYDRLSVRRCLQYAALSMGVLPSEAPQRVAHVAGQLGLADLLERLPTELSRGQRQRVAIGQAIVHQPRVLLLDEPASGLDPEARASLSQLMRALQAQGMTLIVSSHILSELDEYCTHILSLRGGRVESHEALHGGIKAPAAGGDVPLALYALELAPPPGASAG